MNIYKLEKLRAEYEEARMAWYFYSNSKNLGLQRVSLMDDLNNARNPYFSALDEMSEKEEGSK